MKKKQHIVLTVNPRMQQLQEKIAKEKNISQTSIESDTIILLLKQLIGVEKLDLSGIEFNNPDINSLQVTAITILFTKNIKITGIFTLDAASVLAMTISTYETFGMDLGLFYSSGLLPVGEQPTLMSSIMIQNLSFVFDSTDESFVMTGTGEQWAFFGYTDLYVDTPKLTLTKSTGKDQAYLTWVAAGTLTNKKGNLLLSVAINLPVSFTGWTLSLTAPLSLDNGLIILDELSGTDVSSLVPEQFATVLSNIELTAFYVNFTPETKVLNSFQLMVSSKSDWEIINGKLKIKEGIQLTLSGQRYNSDQKLNYMGSINGTAAINYANPEDEIQASATIPIPLSGIDWKITIANDEIPLGIGKLLAIVPGAKEFIPKGLYERLNETILDYLTIKFKFDNGFSFTNIGFCIYSTSEWQLPMLQQAIFLDKNFSFALDIPFPYNSSKTSGEIAGILKIDGDTVAMPINLSKTPSDINWVLMVTSEEIALPSLSAFSGFMGNSVLVAASPPGLMQVGSFTINDLELSWQFGAISKLLRFAFIIRSTTESPAWNIVPGYFELTELSVTIVIDNISVSEKDISGIINATVTWFLNQETKKKLVFEMTATKPSSQQPWNFAGSLEENLELKELLHALHTPQTVVDILPALTITQFDLAIEPTSGSFSIEMAVSTTEKWIILSIADQNIEMESINFSVEKYDNFIDMAATGMFNFGTDAAKAYITLGASYRQKNWTFTGQLSNAGADGITINTVLAKYIPGIDQKTIPQVKISTIDVKMINGTDDLAETYKTLDFQLTGELSLLQQLEIKASVDLHYDSRISASPYEGTCVQGNVDFGGLSFKAIATYTSGAFKDFSFLLTFKHITVTTIAQESTTAIKFEFTLSSDDPNRPLTLGDVISSLIGAATGDVATIPSPWNFLNNISLDKFGFVFQIDKKTKQKTVGLTWKPNINLVFIHIKELSLLYAPGENGNNGPVELRITEGTFLGMPIDQLDPAQRPDWDLRDPSKAPAVPGFGSSAFDLQFLGIGNQVGIIESKPSSSVNQAIDNLTTAFNLDTTGELPPSLYFNKNIGILFGAKFILIEYIQLALVFYDPVMYGLSISVADGKFKNLYFEILYKKINENVGVYQIDLVLPDFVRQQQFGAVAITLPAITIAIYTNGDFIIDMGFPKNGDFSRSFGLELTIFTGSGGFYFGKLSNDTATMLPKADGQFNPVIIFGIGIRAGIGKAINKGILKAELSLTIQVILEGILAWYKANPSAIKQSSKEELYYRVQAQAALVGRIYGEIDFAIISASVEILVRISTQLVLEAYKQSLLTFTAEVYAAVKLRLNLGLFRISISCSFRTTITDSYTIGLNETAPWDNTINLNRNAFLMPLDYSREEEIPTMDWTANMTYPKEQLDLLFIPQISVKYNAQIAPKKQPVAVSMLYIANQPQSPNSTAFTRLSRAFLAWVFNSYFTAKGIKVANILDLPVSITDVNAIFSYFSQEKFTTGTDYAISPQHMYDYFFNQSFTVVDITTQQAAVEAYLNDADQEVGYFPMIPFLQMAVSGSETVQFDQQGACDPAYLSYIKKYFSDLHIQTKERSTQHNLHGEKDTTMAEFLFSDYFSMMAKSGLQEVINGFKQTSLYTKKGDTLNAIMNRYRHYGVTAKALAFANRHQKLNPGTQLLIPSFRHKLRDHEKIKDLLRTFSGVEHIQVNKLGYVEIPAFKYTIPPNEIHTFWSVASRYNINFEEFMDHNLHQPDIFPEDTALLHTYVSSKTVQNILDELQQGPQFNLSNLGGTLSRFFLYGLRIPNALDSKSRIGLYEASFQQFNIPPLVTQTTVTLTNAYVEPFPWLQIGSNSSLVFEFTQDMIDAVTALTASTWLPTLDFDPQEQVKRYSLQAKSFAMANSFIWQNPNTSQRHNVSGDSYIWIFPKQLQQYLAIHPGIPYQAMIQARNTDFSLENERALTPLYWSTAVTVNIRQVPETATPGNYLEHAYFVDGCGEADGQLLQQLLLDTTASIADLDILFSENKTIENNGKPVEGLISNGITSYQTFILQTNYATVSNPELAEKQLSDPQETNLLGMDATKFVQLLWECSVVRSGGYYLHYSTENGGGLPSYIFDTEGNGTITILISYQIMEDPATNGYVLPSFVNSLVIDTKTDAAQDTLFASIALPQQQQEVFDPVLQTIQATILPGTVMFKGQLQNPGLQQAATLTESADQQLQELFQLLEYRLEATPTAFRMTDYALPVGPLDEKRMVNHSIGAVSLESDDKTTWKYSGIIPLYPFAEPVAKDGKNSDPYVANGKSATINFNFLDVFGNTIIQEGSEKLQQKLTAQYTDPVIGLDQWVNVASHYTIATDSKSGKPTLQIQLVFGIDRYTNAKDPVANAQIDLQRYQQIQYQLMQTGITVDLETSIGKLETPEIAPLIALQQYITAIINFLRDLKNISGQELQPIITQLKYGIDVSELTAIFIFRLRVVIRITRTCYIDPQFLLEPGISTATTEISPDLYDGKPADTTALTHFANALEQALPVMKVAVGTSSSSNVVKGEPSSTDSENKEIWLVRFATETEAGIQYKISPSPSYFAIAPLSTVLQSRPSVTVNRPVPIRNYTSGTFLGDSPVTSKFYTGIDMEVLARTFADALDNFLSPATATNAWKVQQSGTASYLNKPFEAIEMAKRNIAAAISNHQVTNILADSDNKQLTVAQSAMEQQLLTLLVNMNRTDAIIQTEVTVAQGFTDEGPNLYGNLLFASNEIPTNAYNLSPIKIALPAGNNTETSSSNLTTMFSVRQENNNEINQGIDLIDEFSAGLNFQLTALEHQFGTPINGYTPSSWLTFAIPQLKTGPDQTPLIQAAVPIPLKAYPTAPALLAQQGIPASNNAEKQNIQEALEAALKWDYTFCYSYGAAPQDLIYLEIQFNVDGKSDTMELTEYAPDLLESLLQYQESASAILADLSDNNNSMVALQSYAWMVQQLANAWPLWFNKDENNNATASTQTMHYMIAEYEDKQTGRLLISVQAVDSSDKKTIPEITIAGFTTKEYGYTADSKIYFFVQETKDDESPLSYAGRKQYSERFVHIKDNQILMTENAWAGVSVHRNEVLAGQETNTRFRYRTPYIRFASTCFPSLSNKASINIASFTPEVTKDKKATLEILLNNFFSALFSADLEKNTLIQLQAGYHFALQTDMEGGLQLGPTLPILLAPPTLVSGAQIDSFTQPFAQAVENWFKSKSVQGINSGGQINLVLTLYAAGNGDTNHRLLTLEDLYLPTALVNFSRQI